MGGQTTRFQGKSLPSWGPLPRELSTPFLTEGMLQMGPSALSHLAIPLTKNLGDVGRREVGRGLDSHLLVLLSRKSCTCTTQL